MFYAKKDTFFYSTFSPQQSGSCNSIWPIFTQPFTAYLESLTISHSAVRCVCLRVKFDGELHAGVICSVWALHLNSSSEQNLFSPPPPTGRRDKSSGTRMSIH